VAEQEALWLKNGGPTDEEWETYKKNLVSFGMDKLLEVYTSAYQRYEAAL
jgi:putative aldouronate transport system substrate-binding protein